MKVLVISLNRATERREIISKFLQQEEIDFQFLDAVDGLSLGDPSRKFHPAVIATFLSHKLALEEASINDELTLILEDDSISHPGVLNKLNKLIKTDLSWDIMLLGWKTKGKIKELNSEFISLDNFILLHAYLVTPIGARRILKYLGESNTHIDIRFSEMIRKNIIRGIFTKEQIFLQNGLKTQIPKKKKVISLI